MRKKTTLALACAAAASISAVASVSHAAAVFTENFSSGDVTDGGIWSTGAISNPANVSFTEPVGGPLTIGVSTPSEGGYVQTANSQASNFDFTTSPMLMTVYAPAGQSLAPATGGGGVFNDQAKTYLGIDLNGNGTTQGTIAPASRLDQSSSVAYGKAIITVNSGNALQFTMSYWDPTLAHPAVKVTNYNMSYNHNTIPTGPNIKVTSLFLYMDGADAANGNFWINAGATWVDTNTNISTTDYLMGPAGTYSNPGGTSYLNSTVVRNTDPATGLPAYNIGNTGGNNGGNFTPAEDLALVNQFAGNTAAAVEVQDITANATSNAVSFGQLTVVVPEPASFGVLALGAPLLLRRKRSQA